MATCRKCGGWFIPLRSFYHTCPNCWSWSPERGSGEFPQSILAQRVHTLEAENRSLRSALAAAEQRALKPFDARAVRFLLQLAHPDRHGNSPIANEVTRALLELRSSA